MKLEGRDFRKLRWQLAVATCLVVTAGAIAYLSSVATKGAETEYRSAAARHAAVDTKLRQVRIEEEEIKNKAALFVQMQERGIVGEEKRLDWVELLRETQRSLHLPDMNYEFAPQKPLAGGAGGDYAFLVSSMKLHLHLVHEGDLLDFLALVQRGAKAVVLVRTCNLVRLQVADSNKSIAQLGADCELDWITVKKADIAKR